MVKLHYIANKSDSKNQLIVINHKVGDFMKFANRTKLVLAESIKELMEHIPLDKITVTQIVNNCGTTRQTFYRNFKDKYDLVNWYFDLIVQKTIKQMGISLTLREGLVKKFSYMVEDAPLDMRMNQDSEKTAADIVNGYSEAELFRIIRDYGEDRFAKNIAKNISTLFVCFFHYMSVYIRRCADLCVT